jgi:hypothetical protein
MKEWNVEIWIVPRGAEYLKHIRRSGLKRSDFVREESIPVRFSVEFN